METLFYLLASTVQIALAVIYWSMLLEAVLSWFLPEDAMILGILSVITAPVVLPVRAILSRIPAVQGLPLDLSFFVAFLLLGLIRGLLPAIGYPA